MKYGLRRRVLGSQEFVDLSEQQYQQIRNAREKLLEALYIEENFDVLVDDYLEFEIDLLASSVHEMIRWPRDYTEFQECRNRISRRIINLLSACRSYIDHTAHHLDNIFGNDTSTVKEIKDEISRQHDQYLGYRFMEELRNYVQHRGYPVHSVRYHSEWVDVKTGKKCLYSLTPIIKTAELEEDLKFKKAVLKEIKSLGQEIDIKPLLREYIEALGNIHEKVRSVLRLHIQDWERTVFESIERFRASCQQGEPVTGLVGVMKNDDGTVAESVPLFEDFIKYRRELEKKNSNLVNLAKRYVTGEVIKS